MKYKHLRTFQLHHNGIITLLGIDTDGTLYIEEFYDDTWVAQHRYSDTGESLFTSDESSGSGTLEQIIVPAEAMIPDVLQTDSRLLFDTSAPRRGIRSDDQIDQLVYPLMPQEKIQLADLLQLSVPPPMLLGLSRSKILSSCELPDNARLICRCVTFAFVLMAESRTSSGEPYNYDSADLYLIQLINQQDEIEPTTLQGIIQDDRWHQPTQAHVGGGQLIIADSGGTEQLNQIHIYEFPLD